MKQHFSTMAFFGLATLYFVSACSGESNSSTRSDGAGGSGVTSAGGTGGAGAGGVGGDLTTGGTAGTGGAAGSLGSAGTTGSGGTLGGAAGTAGAGGSLTGGAAGTAGADAGGSGGGGASLPPTFETFKGILQAQSCYGGLCHDFPENTLDLKLDDGLYARMMNYNTQKCGPLITPGDPEKSALVILLKRECNGTARMPFGDCWDDGGSECLSDDKIAAIEAWVAAGAPQN